MISTTRNPSDSENKFEPAVAVLDDLLSTKLEIPLIGPRLVPRQRLTDMLRSGMERRLTLLVAPTGYGKTTLLAEWLTGIKLPEWRALWVTIDSFDNEPLRLWSYIAAALKKICPRIHFDPNRILQNQTDNKNPEFLIPLINKICQIPHQIMLILDDYQWITNEAVHQEISYLLAHQPKNLHILISSRTQPQLPLSRLRAQSQLVEIGVRDLSFTLPEVNRFFNSVIQLEIGQEQSANLLTTTEGWIAGLQLIGLSLRRQPDHHAFLSSLPQENIQIFEYLTEEVLDQLEPDLRDFLLKISILPEFCAPLCDSMLERSDSEHLLERIQQENLFILPLEKRHHWYSFHRLFADTLRKYLKTTYSADEQIQLHQRASNWLRQNGYPDKAISHALVTGDIESAARILDACALQAVIGFDLGQLSQWIGRFSEDLIRKRPQLGIYYALANFLLERFDGVAPQLEALESMLDQSIEQGVVVEDEALIRWEISALYATLSYWQMQYVDITSNYAPLLQNPPEKDVYFCGLMLHSLAEVNASQGNYLAALESYTRGCQYAVEHSLIKEYCYSQSERTYLLKALGRLEESKIEYEDMLAYVMEHRLSDDVTAFAKAGLAEIYFEQNAMTQAAEQIRWVLENYERVESSPLNWIRTEWLHVRLARYFLAIGDTANAQAFFSKALIGFRANRQVVHYLSAQLIDTQMDIWQVTGELEQGIADFEEKISFLDTLGKAHHASLHAKSRYLLSQNNPAAALEQINMLIPRLEQAELKERLIAALVTKAIVLQSLGQHDAALENLHRAVQYATPIQFCREFIRESSAIKGLLEQLLALPKQAVICPQPKEAALIAECLQAIQDQTAAGQTSDGDTKGQHTLVYPIFEPLSQRELEILRLLNQGKLPKEIAVSLNVSLNTTKGHLKSIYRKIGAHSRSALLQRVSDLGILEGKK